MDYTHKWNPLQDLRNKISIKKTLELSQLTAYEYFIGDNSNILEQSDLNSDGSRGTIWASDGLHSTIDRLGSEGFISSLYTVLNEDIVYTSTINIDSFEINQSTLEIIRGNPRSVNIFSDGTISTHTCVVYGSNTLIVQGNISLSDPITNTILPLQMQNGALYSDESPLYLTNNLIISSINNSVLNFVSSESLASTNEGLINLVPYTFLTSTLDGLGNLGYISSSSLQSTVQSLKINGGGLKLRMINSTIGGIGSEYISSPSLISTTYSIVKNINVISRAVLRSTVRSLQRQSYIGSVVFSSSINSLYSKYVLTTTSTINNLGSLIISSCRTDFLFNTLLTTLNVGSTVEGIGSSYISSQSLISTLDYYFNRNISVIDVNSTLIGVGSVYISSFTSTLDTLSSNIYKRSDVASTVDGLGEYYISSMSLVSTVRYLITDGVKRPIIRSTVEGIGSVYISSISFLSTIHSLLSPQLNAQFSQVISSVDSLGQRYISTPALTSTFDNFVSRFLFVSSIASTLDTLGPMYISSLDLVSTMDSILLKAVYINDLTSTVDSFESGNYISSLDLISSVDYINIEKIKKIDIRSAVADLGTTTYVSSTGLRSTVTELNKTIIFNKAITSTVKGAGSLYLSTSALTSTVTSFNRGINIVLRTSIYSTVKALGSKYVSSTQLSSTLNNILKKYILMDKVISTVDGLKYLSTQNMISTFDSVLAGSNKLFEIYELTSSVEGIGSIFISSLALSSTLDFLLTDKTPRSNFPSTVIGLSVNGYISSIDLTSTSFFILNNNLFKPRLYSTVRGLSRQYVSTSQITSSIASITSPGQITKNLYLSTFNNAATYHEYISSTQYISSFNLTLRSFIMLSNITSTIDNLGILYLSTPAIASTLDELFTTLPYGINIASTIDGLGNLDYISTSQLTSSIDYTNTVVFSKYSLFSTVKSLSTIYITTNLLVSTTDALDNSTRYYPKYDAYYPPYPGPIGLLNITSTIDSISIYYLTDAQIASTATNLKDLRYTVIQSNLNSTIETLSTKRFFNMLQLISSIDGIPKSDVYDFSLNSTIDGLSSIYLYNQIICSTNDYLFGNIGFRTPTDNSITSSIVSLGSIDYVSTSHITSTLDTIFGSNIHVIKQHMISTISGLPIANYIPQSNIASTIRRFNIDFMFPSNLIGMILNIASNSYVSTSQLTSTVNVLKLLGGNISLVQLYNSYNNSNSITNENFIYTGNHLSTTKGLVDGTVSIRNITSNLTIVNPIYTSQADFLTINNSIFPAPTLEGFGDNFSNILTTYFTYDYFGLFGGGRSQYGYIGYESFIYTMYGAYTYKHFNDGFFFKVSPSTITGRLIDTMRIGPNYSITFIDPFDAAVTPFDNGYPKNYVSTSFISRGPLMSTTAGTISNFAPIATVTGIRSTIDNLQMIGMQVKGKLVLPFISCLRGNFGTINILSTGVENRTVGPVSYYKSSNAMNICSDSNGNGGQAIILNGNPNPSFIAVMLVEVFGPGNGYQGKAYYAQPYCSTDGINWSYSTTGINGFDSRVSGIYYNGNIFLMFIQPQTTSSATYTPGPITYYANHTYLIYSSNGANWFTSSWSNNDLPSAAMYYGGCFTATSQIDVYANHQAGANRRMCNALMLYSPKDPTKWYPINVTFLGSFVGVWSNGTPLTPNSLVTNGLFFVYTAQNYGGQYGFYNWFLSYDGINWSQCNTNTLYNLQVTNCNPIAFNIGKYIYGGYTQQTTNFFRSTDGYSWTTAITLSNMNMQFGSAQVAYGSENYSGFALNKGYFFNGNFTYNGSRTTLEIGTRLPSYSANLPTGALRSIGNNPSAYTGVNIGASGPTVYSTNNNFQTSNQTNLSLAVSGALVTTGYSLSAVRSFCTNYDRIPAPSLNVTNIDFVSYFGPMNYFNLTSNALNFLGTQTLTNISTVINFNDTLFVMNNGLCNNVTFGSYQPMDFGSCNTGGPRPNLDHVNRSNLGPAFSTLAFADIDGFLRITGDAIKPTNANWVGYSDKRVKENIYPANLKQCYGVLSTIKLNHYSYISSYAIKYNLKDKSQLGFIAQEVSTLFPKSTPNRFDVLSTGDAYYDLCKGQLDMSHYGATQYLISSMYSRSSLIGNQMIQLETFAGIYSTILHF
jgi:hypothetical protein